MARLQQSNSCCGLRELVDVYTLLRKVDMPYLPTDRLIFATTIDDDPAYDTPETILESAGFRLVTTFRNGNTGNPVNFWVRAKDITVKE